MKFTNKKRLLGSVAVTGLALAAGPMISAQADAPQLAPLVNAGVAHAVAGSYIVVLDAASSPASVNAVAATATATGATVTHTYSTAVKGFSASLPSAALAAVRSADGVSYVEQDVVSRLDDVQKIVQPDATWGIDRSDQRNLPLNHKYKYRNDGSGVSVYVIDTGVNFTHEEFEGRAISGPDFYDDDNDSTDCNGHGTHVSGTVAGKTYGIAQGATIVGVRTIDCGGYGSASDSIAAIDWVTANAPARGRGAINMSLRFPSSQTMNDALVAAYDTGIPAAVAAGNFSQDACIESPAQEPVAVTVGASEIDDSEAYFSNYGTCVDIYAPGVDITSAWIGSDTATQVLSGTSMASPHVAGALAKLLQRVPDATSDEVSYRLVAHSSKDKLSNLGPGSPNNLLFTRKW